MCNKITSWHGCDYTIALLMIAINHGCDQVSTAWYTDDNVVYHGVPPSSCNKFESCFTKSLVIDCVLKLQPATSIRCQRSNDVP